MRIASSNPAKAPTDFSDQAFFGGLNRHSHWLRGNGEPPMRNMTEAPRNRPGGGRPLLPRQHGRQKPEFGLHFGGIGHSIGDFLAKEFAIPLAKPVNGHLERSFRRVHFACQRGIRRVRLPEKEHLQPFEMLQVAVMHELVPQFLHDPVKHRERPTPLENPLRRFIVRRLALVALFAGREFKWYNRSAAAFARALAVLFVGHKEFQGSQNKRSKTALFRVSAIEISPFQHAQEELLREILRLIGRITAPAQIGIQRIPVVLTQINQSRPGFLAMWITGSDHQGPPRRRKLGWAGQRVHGLAGRDGLILTGIPLNRIRKSSAKVTPPLWSSGGLSLSLLDDRNIVIGILPEREEIFVDGGRFRAISGSGQRSGQLETRHWSDRIVQHDTRMIKNLLKLSRCLAMSAHMGVSEATHVDWIESSEEGGVEVCGARNSKVVRSGGLRHFERFRWIALVESFECPQHRQVTELDRRILRVALSEFRCDLVGSRGVVQKRQRK